MSFRVLAAAILMACCSNGAEVPFGAFDELMKDVQLIVPNMTIMSNIYAHLDLDEDGYLQNISLDDVTVETKVESKTEISMKIVVSGAQGVLQGPMGLRVLPGIEVRHGHGALSASIKSLELDLKFHSNDTATLPPTSVDGKVHLKGLDLGMSCTGNIFFKEQCANLETLLGAADKLGGLIENFIANIILKKVIPYLNMVVRTLGDDIAASEVPAPPFPDPEEAEALNMEELEGTINFNNTLVKIGELVVNKVFNVNGTGPNANRLVINEIIDKVVPNGIVSLNTSTLPPITISEGPVTVTASLQSLTVLAIDELTDFNLINVTANHTMQSQLAFSGMKIHIPLAITVEVNQSLVVGGGRFSFGLDLNVTAGGAAKLALIAGVDGQKLMSIQHGSLKQAALPCICETLNVLNMTYFTVDATQLQVDVFTSFLSPPIPNTGGANTLVRSILEGAAMLYLPSVSRTLPMLSLTKVTPIINQLFGEAVNSTAPCPPAAVTSSDEYVDFSESGTIKTLNFLTNDILGDIQSDSDINHVVAVLLDAIKGSVWNGTAFVLDRRISVVVDKVGYGETPAPMHIGYMNMTMTNIVYEPKGAFSDFAVFVPNGTHQLDTHFKGPGMKLSFDVNLTWTNYGDDIYDYSHIEMELDDIYLGVDLAILLFGEKYEQLQLNQSGLSCLYPAMGPHGLRIPFTAATVERARLMLTCYSCTGKVFYEWTKKLETAAAQEAVTDSVNWLLQEAMRVFQSDKAQQHLDIRQSQAVCGEPFPPSLRQVTTEQDGGWWFRFGIMFMIPLFFFLLTAGYTAYRVRLALDPNIEQKFLTEESVDGDDYEVDDDVSTFAGDTWWETLRMDESIAAHPVVPKKFSRLFPLIVLALLTVLLSAQMYYASIGIDASVTIAGQTKYLTVYNYSTYKYCRDGFNAGGLMLFLALCIGGASGAYAWIRVFALVWGFYVPPTVLSHKHRTWLLEFLDYTSKWCLIDPCLNLFFIPMVNLSTYPPGTWAAWVDDLAVASVMVDTFYGFFGFFAYQIMALMLGQLVVFYNRDVLASVRAEVRAEQVNSGKISSGRSATSGTSSVRSYATTTWFKEGAEDTRRESLRAHMHTKFDYVASCLFIHPEPGEKRSRISLPGRVLICGSLIGCITVVIIGAVIPFVGVENAGVINAVIEITPGAEVRRTYTMYEMCKMFTEAAPSKASQVLHLTVCLGIMICVVAVPVLEFILLMGMWFIPLTLTEHKMLFTAAEVAASWSLLDVFTVATFAITVCVHHLLAFVVGNKFDDIDDVLNWGQDWGFVGSTSRFAAANGIWVDGFFFLAAGALVSNVVYLTLFTANKQAIRDREKLAYASWASRTRCANDEDDEEDDVHITYDPKAKLLQ